MVKELPSRDESPSSDALYLHDGTPVVGKHAVALLYLLGNGHFDSKTAVLERTIGEDLCPGASNQTKAAAQLMRGTKRAINGAIKFISAAIEQPDASLSSRWQLGWFVSIPPQHFPYYRPWLPRIDDEQIPSPPPSTNGSTSPHVHSPPSSPTQVIKVDRPASVSSRREENPEVVQLQRQIASAANLEKLRGILTGNRRFFVGWDEEKLIDLFNRTLAHYRHRLDCEISYETLDLKPEFEVIPSGQSNIERAVSDPRFAVYACIFIRQLSLWTKGKSVQRFDVVTDTPTAYELAHAIQITLGFIRAQKARELQKPVSDQQPVDLWRIVQLSDGFIAREKTIHEEKLRTLLQTTG